MKVLPSRQIVVVLKCHRNSNHHLAIVSSATIPELKATLSKQYHNKIPSRRRAERISTRASTFSPPDIGSSPSTSTAPKKRLAVFVSGGGSNFKAIHAAILDGTFDADVAAVVTNAPSCGGAVYAREHGIPVLVHPPPKANPASGLAAEDLTEALTNVCLSI